MFRAKRGLLIKVKEVYVSDIIFSENGSMNSDAVFFSNVNLFESGVRNYRFHGMILKIPQIS